MGGQVQVDFTHAASCALLGGGGDGQAAGPFAWLPFRSDVPGTGF